MATAPWPVLRAQMVQDVNEGKSKIEASVSLSAGQAVTKLQERQEQLQESMDELWKTMPCAAAEGKGGGGGGGGKSDKGPLRPFVIVFFRWLDEVGSLVRASPLKTLIMVRRRRLDEEEIPSPDPISRPRLQTPSPDPWLAVASLLHLYRYQSPK